MVNNNMILGNKLFQDSFFKAYEKEFLQLAQKGQTPKALYIGCSDSRVLPNLITQSAPGDLFVIRNVGNFVAPYKPDEDFHSTASAIEYAVTILKVESIIVCGHTNCGAIEAIHKKSCANNPELVHSKTWLTLGESAKVQAILALGLNADKETLYRLTEKLSVVSQLENLFTYPSVKKRVDSGEITIHGWVYNIECGEIEYYDPEISQFVHLSSINVEEEES
ncbi:MAG: carbonic anhydrase [Sulfurimonas sp.]|jgi:carbonic anhydrase|uniref:carbonic anhydrase n=1 Tax=Sulfurimonas sp. TaxID=2022749 RepID=UPI002611DB66|nr:carbonic anhydrase [Sulfurimonas sp.]MDD3475274.1 carbonic anhydrase [Sulfurimonas sp.]HUH43011.1 carbonic anhydrase [Sulfurimonas sp.]